MYVESKGGGGGALTLHFSLSSPTIWPCTARSVAGARAATVG